ncbi:MAG: glycosyltransferase [Desulfotomaculum sp.]|nr:glycosyltransferase [Desulfotomaculum sp.]
MIVINNKENLGCGAAINQGFNAANGNFVLLLNNDVIVTENWLPRMLAAAESNNEIGIIGPRSNSVPGVQLIKAATYQNEREMHEFAR